MFEPKEVLLILDEIAKSIRSEEFRLNERYLHHFFSHRVQAEFPAMNILDRGSKFHPEWPTFKKSTGIDFGRYKKNEEKKYWPHWDGTAGFIDFTIGDYTKPEIGIEFSLKYSWSNEEIVFDFLKLLHGRNPFNASISFNIIFRNNGLAKGGYQRNFEKHMTDAFKESLKRLGNDMCDLKKRKIYFYVAEIDNHDHRRFWQLDPAECLFHLKPHLLG